MNLNFSPFVIKYNFTGIKNFVIRKEMFPKRKADIKTTKMTAERTTGPFMPGNAF